MKLHGFGKSHYTALAEINITPFVDVVLVLLIIFMITAPLLQQGFAVNVPKSASPELKQTPQDVIVSIDNGGRIFLGDSKVSVSKEELPAKLAAVYRNKEKKDLLIKADQGLRYGTIVDVMSMAQQAGVERIGMVTQPNHHD